MSILLRNYIKSIDIKLKKIFKKEIFSEIFSSTRFLLVLILKASDPPYGLIDDNYYKFFIVELKYFFKSLKSYSHFVKNF